jgi:hypothetical protein
MQPQGQELHDCAFNFFTNSYICVYVTSVDIVVITVAAWCKVHIALHHSRAKILLGAWVCVYVFLCHVAFVGRGLARDQSTVQGDIPEYM